MHSKTLPVPSGTFTVFPNLDYKPLQAENVTLQPVRGVGKALTRNPDRLLGAPPQIRALRMELSYDTCHPAYAVNIWVCTQLPYGLNTTVGNTAPAW
eukprot:jgi/Botrbrau1/15667/Bobra.4_1s0051.1